jgi:hypothetical protein
MEVSYEAETPGECAASPDTLRASHCGVPQLVAQSAPGHCGVPRFSAFAQAARRRVALQA